MTRRLRAGHFWIWTFLGPLALLLSFASARLAPVTPLENGEMIDRLTGGEAP